MKYCISLVACIVFSAAALAETPVSKSMEGAEVYFIEPKEGAVVSQTFVIKFGLKGMGVAPAGINREYTGHHHLLINMESLPDLRLALPASDSVKHYGGGQTETELTLPPGEHTLQLVLGNYAHVPHSEPLVSQTITITVE